MKKIENKKVKIAVEQWNHVKGSYEVELETSYMDLIMGACKRPSNPQLGYSWDDIEKINRIKKLHEDNSEVINVEDSDFQFIIDRVRTNSWTSIDENLLEFKKYLETL